MKTAQDVFYKDLEVNLAAHRGQPRGARTVPDAPGICTAGCAADPLRQGAEPQPAVGGRLGVRLHWREPHRGCTYQPPAPQAGTGK